MNSRKTYNLSNNQFSPWAPCRRGTLARADLHSAPSPTDAELRQAPPAACSDEPPRGVPDFEALMRRPLWVVARENGVDVLLHDARQFDERCNVLSLFPRGSGRGPAKRGANPVYRGISVFQDARTAQARGGVAGRER